MHRGQGLYTGFVLHQRPYRETSAITELFTLEEGRIAVVARGVRAARRRGGQPLAPFRPYTLSCSGRGELLTLGQAESLAPAHRLEGDCLFAGLYANELLLRLCTKHDPHPGVYAAYQHLIQQLESSQSDLDVSLRYFERDILLEIGYGLNLEVEVESGQPINPERSYRYYPDQGAMLLPEGIEGLSGGTILALSRNELAGDIQRREARQLLRSVLRLHLGDRPLKSLQTLKRMKQMGQNRTQKKS